MNEYPQLAAEHLTGIVTGVPVPEEYPFSRDFGSASLREQTPTDAFSWDEVLPNRDLVTTFESRAASATNTTPQTTRKRAATLISSFKKRQVRPAALQGLRAIGGGSNDIAPVQSAVDFMLSDMERRYYREPMEYLICAALQDAISVTIDGVTSTPDFGLASSHDLEVDLSWADPAADIISDVETCSRVVMQDATETVTTAYCGRNVPAYLRRNEGLKEWMVNYAGADSRLDTLVRSKSFSMLGLTWRVMDKGTHVSGTWTPYLNANKVIFVPAISRRWFAVGEGIVWFPKAIFGQSQNVADFFGSLYGRVVYAQGKVDPVSLWVYHNWAEFPVLTDPSAVCNLLVVPA